MKIIFSVVLFSYQNMQDFLVRHRVAWYISMGHFSAMRIILRVKRACSSRRSMKNTGVKLILKLQNKDFCHARSMFTARQCSCELTDFKRDDKLMISLLLSKQWITPFEPMTALFFCWASGQEQKQEQCRLPVKPHSQQNLSYLKSGVVWPRF